ncbi:hypothetical protein HPB50_023351 [Hyalomma asiaticum]|uniref:Uncharacterized protein n=1 Tax=Hyalomma asiaticum TaxID=266040 RepID=A0ACB7TPN3_HYAAI|nr:hypothetical protein HPB50_023351 [Hyalomma asiaticum]
MAGGPLFDRARASRPTSVQESRSPLSKVKSSRQMALAARVASSRVLCTKVKLATLNIRGELYRPITERDIDVLAVQETKVDCEKETCSMPDPSVPATAEMAQP